MLSHSFGGRGATQLAVILMIATVTSCDGPTAPRVEPNTDLGLRVWATVSPTTLSVRDSTTPLRIRVHVQNAEDDTLTISGGPPYVFTGDPTNSHGLEESFRIASDSSPLNGGPNTDYWGKPVYVFAPSQSEYTEADITLHAWRAGGWPAAPGTYRVRSYYNGREGASAEFSLVP